MEAESIFALPGEAFFWFVLTLALNVWILSRGLQRGIEITAKIGMPLLIGFGLVGGRSGWARSTATPPTSGATRTSS